MLTDLTIWSKQIRSDQVDIEPVMFEVKTITGYSDQSVDNYCWQLCFNFFFFFSSVSVLLWGLSLGSVPSGMPVTDITVVGKTKT